MRRLLFSLVCVLFAGCSSSPVVKLYEGPERPAAELLTLRVPVELEILTVNDRRVEGAGTMFAFGHRDLQLSPGKYRVVAYYKNLFQLSGDQHEVVKSDPAVFVVEGQAGDRFALGFERPADVEEARRLARHFDGWVENPKTGERQDSTPSGLITTQGFMGVLSGAASSQSAASPTVEPEPAEPEQPGSDGFTALQEAWQVATPEERQQFLLWMAR